VSTPREVRRYGKRVRPNRPTERAAVRAVTGLFEDANMLVQPVDVANDIGKDLYVDLTEGNRATGEVIALQVKGGISYRRGTDYAIPCRRDDIALWAESTVPIFGFVHDPETGRLLWTNLTAWARAATTSVPVREAPVSGVWNLDRRTLPHFVSEARDFLRASGPPVLVGLADEDPAIQRSAIYDAFALGRRDARPLLLVQASLRYMEDPSVLRLAIHALCLCVGHGDIYWTPRNWIDPVVRSKVRKEMNWNYEDL